MVVLLLPLRAGLRSRLLRAGEGLNEDGSQVSEEKSSTLAHVALVCP